MKKIRVCFLNTTILRCKNDKEKLNLLIKSLRIEKIADKYNFEWSEEEVDYLFISESIYYGEYQNKFLNLYKKLINNNPLTIFFSGECIEPDFNLYDYAVVFDRKLIFGDRCLRIPSKYKYSLEKYSNRIKNDKDASKVLSSKKYFCDFIYSNAKAHPMRDQIFFELSKYKFINSLGRHMKNFDIEVSKCNGWREESILLKSLHKFSIACENAVFDGYVSEKLITSFIAHTIPIYFGDPSVGEEFNKKAFIDVNDFKDFYELINYIKEIDCNDMLYKKIISEPWQTTEQVKNDEINMKKYLSSFEKIFDSDLESVRRKPVGFHPNNYRNAFFSWKTRIPFKIRIKHLIKRIVKK